MRTDNSGGMAEEKREKEITLAMNILDKEIQEQDVAIRSLRDALAVALCEEKPIATNDTEKAAHPDITQLGSRLKAYQAQITNNTRDIRQMVDDLEL